MTRKGNGKTVTETFPTPAAVRKAQREVEEFHRFGQLSRELWEVNEQICRLRPVEETLRLQKKTAEAIQSEAGQEVSRLLQVVFGGLRKTGRIDLEAVERLVRGAMHRAGARATGSWRWRARSSRRACGG